MPTRIDNRVGLDIGYYGWQYYSLNKNVMPVGFSPGFVGGLVLLVDGSDPMSLYTDTALTTNVSADGDRVRGWKDKSGNNNHLTCFHLGQDPSGIYKTGILGGKSLVRADGTNGTEMHATFTLAQPCTVVAVFRENTPGSFHYMWDGYPDGSTQNTMALVDNNSTTQWELFAGAGAPTFNLTANSYYLIIATYNGASSEVWLNNDLDQGTGNAGAATPNGINLFGRGDGSQRILDADIAELAIYSKVLSATNRHNLQSYYSSKWALGF